DLMPRKPLERFAKNAFTLTEGVKVAGIEEIDPVRERTLDDRPGMVRVQDPFPPGRAPETHRSKRQPRDLEVARPEFRIFQGLPPDGLLARGKLLGGSEQVQREIGRVLHEGATAFLGKIGIALLNRRQNPAQQDLGITLSRRRSRCKRT